MVSYFRTILVDRLPLDRFTFDQGSFDRFFVGKAFAWWLWIVADFRSNLIVQTNFHQTWFELGSLGLQAIVLPIEPALIVSVYYKKIQFHFFLNMFKLFKKNFAFLRKILKI